MTEVHALEMQRCTATRAADRVGCTRDLVSRYAESEAEGRPGSRPPGRDVGDERVVGVQDERGIGTELVGGRLDRVGYRVQLPETVELVTEDPGDDEHRRVDLGHDAWQCPFVDLDQQEPAGK